LFSECTPHLLDLENLPDDLNNDRDQDTKNDHSGDREIEFEIFFFNPDVSRQPADPVQFIVKEIDDHSQQNDHDSRHNYVFAGIAIHAAKLNLLTVYSFCQY
jgi:hypothetical protein